MPHLSAPVILVPTGTANMASVCAALSRCGAHSRLSLDPSEIADAAAVILPGVGAFGPAMSRLRACGADRALRHRISAGRATLCICLGMQLLCEGSDESPGDAGLRVLDARVERFSGVHRVPQMGWNSIEADPQCALLRSGCAYFANSYRLVVAPDGWRSAASDYGGRFVAALERDAVLACQFHPELSGAFGQSLLSRWLHKSLERESVSC